MANLEIIFYIPNRFTTFFLKRYTALSFKTDMTARFCACNACRYFFLSYEFIEFIKLLRVVNLPSERFGCGKPLTDGNLCGMKRTKSRHGGEVRAGALSCA